MTSSTSSHSCNIEKIRVHSLGITLSDFYFLDKTESTPICSLCLALLRSQLEHGTQWKKIAEDVNVVSLAIANAIGTEPNVRNGNQCRERFVNHLDPRYVPPVAPCLYCVEISVFLGLVVATESATVSGALT